MSSTSLSFVSPRPLQRTPPFSRSLQETRLETPVIPVELALFFVPVSSVSPFILISFAVFSRFIPLSRPPSRRVFSLKSACSPKKPFFYPGTPIRFFPLFNPPFPLLFTPVDLLRVAASLNDSSLPLASNFDHLTLFFFLSDALIWPQSPLFIPPPFLLPPLLEIPSNILRRIEAVFFSA